MHRLHACHVVRACQGGWDDDETVEGAALRETVEEAGVRGQIQVRRRGAPAATGAKEGGFAAAKSLASVPSIALPLHKHSPPTNAHFSTSHAHGLSHTHGRTLTLSYSPCHSAR
jgi:8-oxo-dGTP pyrophosphatase MutT (NUDIX family)